MSRTMLTITSAEKLENTPIPGETKNFMSGYCFTDIEGDKYTFPCEVTLLLGEYLWVNSNFAHNVKTFLLDNPGQSFLVTTEISDTGEFIRPRFKGAALELDITEIER